MNKSIYDIQVKYLLDCIDALTPELLFKHQKITTKELSRLTGLGYELTWQIQRHSKDLVAKMCEYNNQLEAFIKEQYAELAPQYNLKSLPAKVRVDSPLFERFIRLYNKGNKKPTVLAKKLNTSRVTVTSYLNRLKDYERQKSAMSATVFDIDAVNKYWEDLKNEIEVFSNQ